MTHGVGWYDRPGLVTHVLVCGIVALAASGMFMTYSCDLLGWLYF